MANEILSPSTLPSLICKGCPPGPSAVPVNFVPSCLKENVIDMPPPSGPPISPVHFPVTSAARARQVVSANRIAHLTVLDLLMKQGLSVHDIIAFSMGLLSYVKGRDVPGDIGSEIGAKASVRSNKMLKLPFFSE